jgi:erythritol kinase
MDACIGEWVTPLLGAAEEPDAALVQIYDRMFATYKSARLALEPVWDMLAPQQVQTCV